MKRRRRAIHFSEQTMPRILDARHVLAVRDLQSATRFYMEVLGFQRDFGDGADGVVVSVA